MRESDFDYRREYERLMADRDSYGILVADEDGRRLLTRQFFPEREDAERYVREKWWDVPHILNNTEVFSVWGVNPGRITSTRNLGELGWDCTKTAQERMAEDEVC